MSNATIAHAAASPATSRDKPLAARLAEAFVSRLVIIVPYVWLLIFFLVPFVIVFKISLSTTAIAMPPYTPVFNLAEGWQALQDSFGELSWDNYTFLTEDP